VANAFRQVAERRRWSWLLKRGQFLVPDVYDTGTVAVTNNSTAVVGTGTTFTSAMAGRQFRISGSPIYTIATYTDATHIVLDDEYGGDTDAAASYEIYQCYFEAPTDFHSFVTVFDPSTDQRLSLNYTQRELDTWDVSRSNSGDAYAVAAFDYRVPSGETVAVPRYELWPHKKAQYVYPFLYESRPTDLQDSGATLPRFLRGDVLLEMALAEAARWPGPSSDKPNPYFSIQLASMHDKRAEQMIIEMEKQDDNVFEDDVTYLQESGWPSGPFMDAEWMQSHDF